MFWPGIFQFRIHLCVNFQFKLQSAFASVPASSLVSHLSYDLWPLSFDLKVHTLQRNSKPAEETLHTCLFWGFLVLFFFWSAYRKLTIYKTQYWKTLITLQVNTKLSSGNLAKNSINTKVCQQQGSTQTLLREIRWTFSWMCYRSCIYLSQSLNLHGISHGWSSALNIAAPQKVDLYFSNWFIKPQQRSYSPTLIKSFTYLTSLRSISLPSLFMSRSCQLVISS